MRYGGVMDTFGRSLAAGVGLVIGLAGGVAVLVVGAQLVDELADRLVDRRVDARNPAWRLLHQEDEGVGDVQRAG